MLLYYICKSACRNYPQETEWKVSRKIDSETKRNIENMSFTTHGYEFLETTIPNLTFQQIRDEDK